MDNKIKIGIVGFGTIGKRIADAVQLQNDMELVGVTGRTYNYRIQLAKDKGIKIYPFPGYEDELAQNGIQFAGTFDDLLDNVDIIVDCSPKPYGKENKEKYYLPKGVKAIFQGGEKSDAGEVSFVAQCNYNEALNKNYVRVVSCNTTGLSRTLNAIDKLYGIKKCQAMLVRRGTDPHDVKKGPLDAVVPTLKLPSHHGPDVQTVMPNLDIFTTAIIVPTTIMHMHSVNVQLQNPASKEEVLELLKNTQRVRIVRNAEKVNSTAAIMELAKDLGYKRGDMMDICVWDDSVNVYGNELYFMQAVHQESDVVPENIDAIRAMMGFQDKEFSMRMTNQSLGLK